MVLRSCDENALYMAVRSVVYCWCLCLRVPAARIPPVVSESDIEKPKCLKLNNEMRARNTKRHSTSSDESDVPISSLSSFSSSLNRSCSLSAEDSVEPELSQSGNDEVILRHSKGQEASFCEMLLWEASVQVPQSASRELHHLYYSPCRDCKGL